MIRYLLNGTLWTFVESLYNKYSRDRYDRLRQGTSGGNLIANFKIFTNALETVRTFYIKNSFLNDKTSQLA